jgi:hypothetical protein
LDPVEGFFLGVVEGEETLGVVVTPPLVVAGEVSLGGKLGVRFSEVSGGGLEAVFFREGVVYRGGEGLLGSGVTLYFPGRGGFTTVVVEDLLAVIDAVVFSESGFGRDWIGGVSDDVPVFTFGSASGVESSARGGKGNFGNPFDGDGFVCSCSLQEDTVMRAMRESVELASSLFGGDGAGEFSSVERQAEIAVGDASFGNDLEAPEREATTIDPEELISIDREAVVVVVVATEVERDGVSRVGFIFV